MDFLTQFYPDMHGCKNTNDIWSWYHYVDFKIKVETKRKKLTMFSEKSTSNVKYRNQVLKVVSQCKRRNPNHSTFLLLNTLIHGASLHDYFWKKTNIRGSDSAKFTELDILHFWTQGFFSTIFIIYHMGQLIQPCNLIKIRSLFVTPKFR